MQIVPERTPAGAFRRLRRHLRRFLRSDEIALVLLAGLIGIVARLLVASMVDIARHAASVLVRQIMATSREKALPPVWLTMDDHSEANASKGRSNSMMMIMAEREHAAQEGRRQRSISVIRRSVFHQKDYKLLN